MSPWVVVGLSVLSLLILRQARSDDRQATLLRFGSSSGKSLRRVDEIAVSNND